MNCPNCGYEMAAFDTQCGNCQTESRGEVSCSHCDTVNGAGSHACKKCENQFTSHISPEAALDTAGKPRCQKCGSIDGQNAASRVSSPPCCPVYRVSHVGSLCVTLIGFPLALTALAAGPILASVGVLFVSALWYAVLLGEGHAEAQGRANHRAEFAHWEQKMQAWNRSFSCSHCHRVYDPQAGNAEPLPASELLIIPTRTRAAVYAIGTACTFLLLVWGITAGVGRQRHAQEGRMRAAIEAHGHAEIPQAEAAITAGESVVAAKIAFGQLPQDLQALKERKDSIAKQLDVMETNSDEVNISDQASQMTENITRLKAARQAVSRDLETLNVPVVLASPPEGSSEDHAPSSQYGIITKVGGGPPPDPASHPQ